jgi:hypothetical protein
MSITTLAKIEANRENALASTGPKSAEGKAMASRNAIRHGLLSWKPVIPGLESSKDWQAHLERTMESLAPVGYLENLLAERIALLMWWLSRVARYEREVLSVATETAQMGWTRYRAGEDLMINARRRKSPLHTANSEIQAAKQEAELGQRLCGFGHGRRCGLPG